MINRKYKLLFIILLNQFFALRLLRHGLLGKAGINKLNKLVNRLLLIGAACNNANACSAHNTERKNTEKALGVNSALLFLNPD